MEKSEGVVKVETAKKGVDALRRKEKRLLAKNRRSTETRKRTPLLLAFFPLLSRARRVFPCLIFRSAPIFTPKLRCDNHSLTYSPQNRTRRAPPRKNFQKILKKARKNLQSLFVFVKITSISDGKSDGFRFSVVATRVFAVRRLFSSRFFGILFHRDRRRPKRWPRRPSQP